MTGFSYPTQTHAPQSGHSAPTKEHAPSGGGHSINKPAAPGGHPGAAPPAPAPAAGKPKPPATTPQQQSAFDLMKTTLEAWGLGSLYQHALGYLRGGLSSDEVDLKLQSTAEWKARFAGNEMRKKAGLAVLSPAEYLAAEEGYQATLRQYGIPKGFYDDKNATDNWIGSNVSPAELSGRVSRVSELINGDKAGMKAWNQFYGGGVGGAIAAVLDPKAAAPLVDQQISAAEIGGSALSNGLSTSAGRAMQLAKYGVTLDQARAAYSDIAARATSTTSAAHRFGTSFTQADDENATLLDSGAAKAKQALLFSEESAQFGGHGGASDASNNVASNY